MMDDEDNKMSSRNYPRNVEDDDHDKDNLADDHDKDNMDDDDDDDDDDGGDGVQRIGKDEDDDDFGVVNSKKRKLKNVLSNYEFAPRIPAQSSSSKSSYGGRMPVNAHVGWSEDETLILLNIWGDLFLKKQGKNILAEEWQEIAENVSQESKIERTDTQCKNRMDTLKKLYKKEKMKLKDEGNSGSSWIHFEKMDMLLSSGVDSREHVFRNQSNEMRDSPAHSEGELEGGSRGSLNVVADAVRKITEIFEKVERSTRQKVVELQNMQKEFYRDLEIKRREIWERAQADIEKIRQDDNDDDDDDEKNGRAEIEKIRQDDNDDDDDEKNGRAEIEKIRQDDDDDDDDKNSGAEIEKIRQDDDDDDDDEKNSGAEIEKIRQDDDDDDDDEENSG